MIKKYNKEEEAISLVGESTKNKYGQYFTPKMVAELMIDLTEKNPMSKVLEPTIKRFV